VAAPGGGGGGVECPARHRLGHQANQEGLDPFIRSPSAPPSAGATGEKGRNGGDPQGGSSGATEST
jgi:hypothetical protein